MRNLPSVFGLVLASCGASHTLVLERPESMEYRPATAVPASFELRAAPPASNVAPETVAVFEDRIRTRLAAAEISGLLIEYRFVHAGTDDQLGRWFTGGSGRRTVTVDVVFKNSEEERLARIQAEGRYRQGLLGGSLVSAMLTAADEVADFAIAAFGRG